MPRKSEVSDYEFVHITQAVQMMLRSRTKNMSWFAGTGTEPDNCAVTFYHSCLRKICKGNHFALCISQIPN